MEKPAAISPAERSPWASMRKIWRRMGSDKALNTGVRGMGAALTTIDIWLHVESSAPAYHRPGPPSRPGWKRSSRRDVEFGTSYPGGRHTSSRCQINLPIKRNRSGSRRILFAKSHLRDEVRRFSIILTRRGNVTQYRWHAAALVVFLAAFMAGVPTVAAQQHFISIATGGTAGTYYPLGGALGEIY